MILVTGASGMMGKAVLHEVAKVAAKTGENYRAMYRSATEAAKAPAGSSTVIADFGKKDSLPPSLRSQGAFHASMGNARVSFVDARDIAVVAAKALAGGEHSGKTYELNGPEALTYAELAEKITKHSGRDVQYVDIPPEVQRKALLDRGMLEWQADALLDLQAYYVKGKGGNVDGLLEQLIGRPPITMDQFLSEFPSEFRPHVEVQALADAATA